MASCSPFYAPHSHSERRILRHGVVTLLVGWSLVGYIRELIMAKLCIVGLHSTHYVSKKRANFGSCSFVKDEILIILAKQHQHTFKSGMHIQLILSLHFAYLIFAFK